MTDNSLELTVAIARCRNGGGRPSRKLRDLAHDEVIKQKIMHLFNPVNRSNNLCFAMCLANYLNPHSTSNRLEAIATDMQMRAGFTPQQKIFSDIAKFEALYSVKVVVFYRRADAKLLHYQTDEKPNDIIAFIPTQRALSWYSESAGFHGCI